MGECSTLRILGVMYKDLKMYEEALDYYQRSLKISRQLKIGFNEIEVLECIGEMFFELAQYTQALDYYQQALFVAAKVNARRSEAKFIQIINELNSRINISQKS